MHGVRVGFWQIGAAMTGVATIVVAVIVGSPVLVVDRGSRDPPGCRLTMMSEIHL
jgi:hypothetical protein